MNDSRIAVIRKTQPFATEALKALLIFYLFFFIFLLTAVLLVTHNTLKMVTKIDYFCGRENSKLASKCWHQNSKIRKTKITKNIKTHKILKIENPLYGFVHILKLTTATKHPH